MPYGVHEGIKDGSNSLRTCGWVDGGPCCVEFDPHCEASPRRIFTEISVLGGSVEPCEDTCPEGIQVGEVGGLAGVGILGRLKAPEDKGGDGVAEVRCHAIVPAVVAPSAPSSGGSESLAEANHRSGG